MVSIIIPVYNVAPYIEDCLRSVMRQTYKGTMECILVDDCGTDNSISIAEMIIASYKGPITFVILRHERNRGLSAARNTGTIAAQGDYVFYLDGDDRITEECIELLAAPILQDPTIEFVQGNTCSIFIDHGIKESRSKINTTSKNREKKKLGAKFVPAHYINSNEEIRELFLNKKQITLTAWNKLIKRSFLINNRLMFKEGLLWEDSYWFFFLLKYVSQVCYIQDVTYFHKRRPNSIVTGTDKKTWAKHRAVFFHDVLVNLSPHKERSEMKYIMQEFVYRYSRFVRELPEYKIVFSLFWKETQKHRAYGLNARLVVCYVLGKTKWGWGVFPIQERLFHPGIFLRDIHRLRREWRFL